jgi:hypothetical protein
MKLWGRVLVAALVSVLFTSVLPATAADPPPSLDARSDKTTYVAGQTANIAVAVSNSGPSTHLRVVATFANGTTKVLDDTDVYSGTKRYAVYMYFDTRIDAYVAGATEPDDTLKLPVQAAIGSAIGGYYQRSGAYAVFAKGTEPVFRSATTPAHAGRCIKHEVWRHYASGWKPILLSACKLENTQGAVTWRWVGTHGSGVNFRVRAKFPGDRLNHPNAGKFIYFRFK